jgi:nucleoside-diphosphate-sugar epimerase
MLDMGFWEGKKILVTGGAGFIGSNLTAKLLSLGADVVVLDNLETGKEKNVQPFLSNPKFSFVHGDICSISDVRKAITGVDAVSHQAALGSVPRSIEFPHRTHEVNATGFLNVLHSAKENGVKRFVYASSSSVYGDSLVSPKTIGSEGNLLSPYAVTKGLNEEYAAVYSRLHGMESIGLRYFNVFGPNQDPHGMYAAAIPKFIEILKTGGELTVHGDGEQTRDFTYVDNAVTANLLALSTTNADAFGGVYNVACGSYYSLNTVIANIKDLLAEKGELHPDYKVIHGPDRHGDIKDSLADIQLTQAHLGYENPISFKEGMKRYLSSTYMRD